MESGVKRQVELSNKKYYYDFTMEEFEELMTNYKNQYNKLMKMEAVEMTLQEYQDKAMSTKIYDVKWDIIYPALKINGEAGEIAEKVGKILRDKAGVFTQEDKDALIKEVGDVLWYCAALAKDLGVSLTHVAEVNIQKLASRKERNVIHGNGDNR